jgi:hypothetical protein
MGLRPRRRPAPAAGHTEAVPAAAAAEPDPAATPPTPRHHCSGHAGGLEALLSSLQIGPEGGLGGLAVF